MVVKLFIFSVSKSVFGNVFIVSNVDISVYLIWAILDQRFHGYSYKNVEEMIEQEE